MSMLWVGGEGEERGASEAEDVLAAVLVVADELFAFAGAGDGEGVLVFVGHAAGALVAFHGDVSPYAAVGPVARDVEYLLFGGFLASDVAGDGFCYGCFDHFRLGFRFGFGLRFENYGIKNGFGCGLIVAATKEKNGCNHQGNQCDTFKNANHKTILFENTKIHNSFE